LVGEKISLSKTKNGIKICLIIMILVLVVNLLATIVVNVMWDNLWERVGGEDDEFQTRMKRGDTDYYIMVYNRGIERIWNFLIAYFIIILILCMFVIFGAILIYKGSLDFGETHEKMAKLALIFLVIWFISDHLLGTFGSIKSVTVFNILGSVAFAAGIVLLIYGISIGRSRTALIAGGGVYTLGRIIGSTPSQSTAIAGSIIAAVGFLSIILAYFMTLKNLNRTDFSISELFHWKAGRVREVPISDTRPHRSADQNGIIAADVDRYKIEKEAAKESTIDLFSERFNISKHHASLLYEAGYISEDDFKLATIEEILFVDGVNPTIARKILDMIEPERNLLDEILA